MQKGTYRDIARQFGVSKDAVSRHVNEGHIAARLKKAQEAEDIRAALDVTKQLVAMNHVAVGVLQDARTFGDPRLVLAAMDRVHAQLALQAKLLGDLDVRPVYNIVLHPQWVEVRTVIVQALTPHPEAQRAVLAAIEEASTNGHA